MANIQETLTDFINKKPETNAPFINNKVDSIRVKCKDLEIKFNNKFFPNGEPIKISEDFGVVESVTINIFREAALWWNANKLDLGNHYENEAIPFDNMMINMYISQQIKNLENKLEEQEIEVGKLELHDYLHIPAQEILDRDITKIIKPDTESESESATNISTSSEEASAEILDKLNISGSKQITYNNRKITIMEPIGE